MNIRVISFIFENTSVTENTRKIVINIKMEFII